MSSTSIAIEKAETKSFSFSFKAIIDSLLGLSYTILGLGALVVLWYLVCKLTDSPDLPTPAATFATMVELLKHPFYTDPNSPTSMGIGLQILFSLGRVMEGFLIGTVIAIPLGALIGSSKLISNLFMPLVNILKPVSPLAWFPIGLAILKSSPSATIFIITITSLWPTVVNTAFGVANISEDHKNVAKAFGFSNWKFITKILFPSALPSIITGLRLSIGVAWLVIVAGEMLSGGSGIGFYVWDSYNGGDLTKVICAILFIGVVGLLLDKIFTTIEKYFSYGK
jgi:nitrate/nitrite transport system permease protein